MNVHDLRHLRKGVSRGVVAAREARILGAVQAVHVIDHFLDVLLHLIELRADVLGEVEAEIEEEQANLNPQEIHETETSGSGEKSDA